jgi:hypothetical protein
VYISREQGKYGGGEVGPGVVREARIAHEIPEDASADELTVKWFSESIDRDHGARRAGR